MRLLVIIISVIIISYGHASIDEWSSAMLNKIKHALYLETRIKRSGKRATKGFFRPNPSVRGWAGSCLKPLFGTFSIPLSSLSVRFIRYRLPFIPPTLLTFVVVSLTRLNRLATASKIGSCSQGCCSIFALVPRTIFSPIIPSASYPRLLDDARYTAKVTVQNEIYSEIINQWH